MATLNRQELVSTSPNDISSVIGNVISHVFDEEPYDWQKEAISALLGGRDVIVSAATGSGKSRVFQVPALAVDGAIVLVIAPVKSLLRDQVHLHLFGAHFLLVQVASLTPRGVCAVSLTAETDKRTYNLVADGHFQIVYATPEILIKRGSRFRNLVMTREGNDFVSNLLSIAIDEAHIPVLWGHFRTEYQELPILRHYFPSASIVALSATFSQRMKRHIVDTMSMTDPIYIHQSIRRRNICKIVSTIQKPGYGDLDILLPEVIVTPNDIPTTLIFHDSIEGGIAIARYVRRRLTLHLSNDSKVIIRVYAGFLPDDVRSQYEQDVASGRTRIMVCTDAYGMGVNLKGIKRVIQWKVMSNLGIEGIDQRAGRAGRCRDEPLALAITFIDPALATPLFQKSRNSEPTAAEKEAGNGDENDDDDNDDGVNSDNALESQEKHSKGKKPIQIPKLLYRLTTAVTALNRAEVGSLLAEIATLSSKSLLSRNYFHRSWYKQDPGGLWYMNVVGGCRHRVLMALFDDPDTFREDDIWDDTTLCCDICIKAALDAKLLSKCPVIHGISVSIGLAFQMTKSASAQFEVNPVDVDNLSEEPLPTKRLRISPSRIRKVEDDIRAWRTSIATKVIPAHRVLSEKAISKILKAVKTKEPTDTLIREALEQSGISATNSGIRNHIPTLLKTITDSLTKSRNEQPLTKSPNKQHSQRPIMAQYMDDRQRNLPDEPREHTSSVTLAQVEYMRWVGQQGQREMAAVGKTNNLKRKNQSAQEGQNNRRQRVLEEILPDNINTVICPLRSENLTIRTRIPLLDTCPCVKIKMGNEQFQYVKMRRISRII
jgi:superfamily II DNA/RNA helicase